jgi:hypothetical protein
MATYPAPVVPVFGAGYCPQQTDFTTWWYDTASFFQNRIVARVAQETTTTSIASSGTTVVGFDTVLEDTYSGWTGSPSFLWTPPSGYSGWYQVTATLYMQDLVAGTDIRPVLTGTYSSQSQFITHLSTIQGSSTQHTGACGTITIYLNGGLDTVQLSASLLNASAAVSTSDTAGQTSTMEIVWLSD